MYCCNSFLRLDKKKWHDYFFLSIIERTRFRQISLFVDHGKYNCGGFPHVALLFLSLSDPFYCCFYWRYPHCSCTRARVAFLEFRILSCWKERIVITVICTSCTSLFEHPTWKKESWISWEYLAAFFSLQLVLWVVRFRQKECPQNGRSSVGRSWRLVS